MCSCLGPSLHSVLCVAIYVALLYVCALIGYGAVLQCAL
jgi:hypothetical protein